LIDQKPPVLTNGEKNLPICAGRKHDFLGGGVEGGKEFLIKCVGQLRGAGQCSERSRREASRPAVRANSSRTSGFLEISSTVSGIN